MGVTLKQIADELGVSQPLVTYALNGRPGVSPAMRVKIQETAARMGYSRAANSEAQFLIAKRHGKRPMSGVIALVYPLFQRVPGILHTPFYHTMIEGIELEVRKRDLDLLITPTCGERIPRIIRDRRVDGVMFVSDRKELNPDFQNLNVPAVSLSTWNDKTHNLLPDDEGGAYLATTHLLKLGHRKIAYSGALSYQGDARFAGYKRALAEYDVPFEPRRTVRPEITYCQEDDGRSSMKVLSSQCGKKGTQKPDFTAIVCQNDSLAMGVARVAQESGLRVPEDLSIVGFDDITSLVNFQPQLTSVAYPRTNIGSEGVRWLCEEVAKMARHSDDTGFHYENKHSISTFPVTLSVHASTCPPPADN